MQNYALLHAVGEAQRPVLLKRGMMSTIEELLMSAEYILSHGNDRVILCERGIRTFEKYTRNTLDLSAIPVLKKLTHLPVVVDPSHATGMREKVAPMARAAVAAGADGLMIEVHHDPDNALSDGPQSLYPDQFGQLTRDIYVISPVVGKQLDFDYLTKVNRHVQQSRQGKTVAAYLGHEGSFGHIACTQYFGEQVQLTAKPTFRAIFEAVTSGEVVYGIVPFENSLTGSIHENYDLLLEFDLKMVGELYLRINNYLIAKPGTTLDDIKRVWSKSEAIEQCRQFLNRYPDWEIIPVNATSSAVRQISGDPHPTHAALGSREAAQMYDMEILAEGIETNPRNFTRFVVVGNSLAMESSAAKSSIVFSTLNQPGALVEVMKVFADNQINMVKLESRPIHGKPWQYMFYADLETDIAGPEAAAVVKKIEEQTDFFRILGSY
jgi:prephenate dehydratase